MRKIYNKEFQKPYSSSEVTVVTKLRRKKWKAQLARKDIGGLMLGSRWN
jgi:hypothetical protein